MVFTDDSIFIEIPVSRETLRRHVETWATLYIRRYKMLPYK